MKEYEDAKSGTRQDIRILISECLAAREEIKRLREAGTVQLWRADMDELDMPDRVMSDGGLYWGVRPVLAATQTEKRCPKCGAKTFANSHCPATDHPETTTEWDRCGECDWESDHRPAMQTEKQP